jgi:hypothetical protein
MFSMMAQEKNKTGLSPKILYRNPANSATAGKRKEREAAP